MITVSCDVCKKKLEDSDYGRTFFFYSKHSVCESCKDNLEYQVKYQVRGKEPFAFDWYEKYKLDTLEKATHRGRI